jgi:hypothetical protein
MKTTVLEFAFVFEKNVSDLPATSFTTIAEDAAQTIPLTASNPQIVNEAISPCFSRRMASNLIDAARTVNPMARAIGGAHLQACEHERADQRDR